MLSAASRISGLVSAGSVLGIFLCNPITRFRNRNAGEPPPEEHNRIASNHMLLNFDRTGSPGGSSHEP